MLGGFSNKIANLSACFKTFIAVLIQDRIEKVIIDLRQIFIFSSIN